MKKGQISFPNRLEELSNFRNAIEEFIGESIELRTKSRIILSLDEIVSNIIEHGFPNGGESQIKILLEQSESEIKFVVEDEGVEFNPLQKKPVDVDEHLELGEDGGMGIYIVQKIMKMDYERSSNKNRLYLRKALKEKEE
ncbi:MAG: ATP-binding protein [Leptospiraceae bacterium]|nr:ATP-binding protein [Leptospiraceae bacterium]